MHSPGLKPTHHGKVKPLPLVLDITSRKLVFKIIFHILLISLFYIILKDFMHFTQVTGYVGPEPAGPII